jgi:arginine deiminase
MERIVEHRRFTHLFERDENALADGGFTFCTLTKNARRTEITAAKTKDHAKEMREC